MPLLHIIIYASALFVGIAFGILLISIVLNPVVIFMILAIFIYMFLKKKKQKMPFYGSNTLSNVGNEPNDCPWCYGEGKEDCSYCNNSESKDCSWCYGEGKVDCCSCCGTGKET